MRSRTVSRLAIQVGNGLPAVLAFALLLYQIAVPWLVPHFTTQDGPSHLYSATVLWDLLLHHKTSVYSPLYTIQRELLPNWTSTVVLAAGRSLVGAKHAEQLFLALAFLTGFLAWCYARRALAPGESLWTPVANFLYQSWFLWIGFFNFYLGIALLPLAIGFYAQKEGWLSLRRAAVLAFILLAVFATHLIAAVVALVTVLAIAFWVHIAVPAVCGGNVRRRWLPPLDRLRQFGLLLLAAAPAMVLMAVWIAGAEAPAELDPRVAWAWKEFPMHIFLTAGGEAKQRLLWEVLLCYAGLAVLLLKRREWASAKGGLVLATLLVFAAYLLVPDRGLGGSEAKIRFSWAVFVLAGLVACSASRLRFLHVPMAIFFTWFGWANTMATERTAAAISNVAGDYLAVASGVAAGSSLVRLRYPTPQLAAQYGYQGSGRDPVFHLDALVAAGGHCLDLSDYEALGRIFPVVFKDYLNAGQLSGLWSFEGPDPDSDKTLRWINDSFPVPADFVLVVGDVHSPDAVRMGMPHMIDYLDSSMHPVASSPGLTFRLWERRCEAPAENPERTAGRACAQ
jgi:hypothetical protein